MKASERPLRTLGKLVACDTETTGLSTWHGCRPFAFSFCDSDGLQAFRRCEVDPRTREVLWYNKELQEFQEFFGDASRTFVFHNEPFDRRMIEAVGITIKGRTEDTLAAMHALNSGEDSFKLKKLAKKYCEYSDDDEKELAESTKTERKKIKAKKLNWKLAESWEADYWVADRKLLEHYACCDAERTMMLWLMVCQWLEEESVVGTYHFEMKLNPVTKAMEDRGIRIDVDLLRKLTKHYEQDMVRFRTVLDKYAPGMNFNSPKQLGHFLYGSKSSGLNLACKGWTDKGNPSTNGQALEKIDHPFVKSLMKFRSAEKALTSFLYRYEEFKVRDPLNKGGYVMHPHFRQQGTRTGRYSCANPNLQNVPDPMSGRMGLERLEIRGPLGPRPGYVWMHYDYSQLEIRIFACHVQDKDMLEALRSGRDLHAECCRRAWGRASMAAATGVRTLEFDTGEPPSSELLAAVWKKYDVRLQTPMPLKYKAGFKWLESYKFDIIAAELAVGKKTNRTRAKVLFFCKLYGGGAPAIANVIGCSEQDARVFSEEYDEAMPSIQKFIRQSSRAALRDGYITTMYGRRIDVDERWPYKAANYRIQGTAADALKRAMLKVHKLLCAHKEWDAHLVLTVHDEIVIEWNLQQVTKERLQQVRNLMMADPKQIFSIPLPVDVERTTVRWDKIEKVEL